MHKLMNIGTATYEDGTLCVVVHAEYRKGLYRIDDFSHLHMVGVTEGGEFVIISGKVALFDKNEGTIWIMTQSTRLTRMHDRFDVLDIKPYMPSEDYAITTDCGTEHTEFMIQKTENGYQMDECGEIRNTKGVAYLQFRDVTQIPKKLSEYIHVIWWFDKFEDKRYRSVMRCNPPYETGGSIGVFASRSPVRPNPIALTVARVAKIDTDEKRVYIHGIESFDHTPFLGILDYNINWDRFDRSDVKLPVWAGNWPDHIAITDVDKQTFYVNQLAQSVDEKNQAIYEGNDLATQDDAILMNDKPTHIVVKGAYENNLKGISVTIPYGKITAVVGVSGSGKSSLVMDTVYAECKRRMDALSSEYVVRQRPKMDGMSGCMPTVMISQKEIRSNSNSTIGTFSGIYSHLRYIYGTIGKKMYSDPNQVDFKLSPSMFSYMDPDCRCKACNGKGIKYDADLDKIIADPDKSLLDGASPFLGKLKNYIENPNANWMKGQVVALANDSGVDLCIPWKNLPKEYTKKVLYGDASKKVTFTYDNKRTGRKGDITRNVEGIIPIVKRLYVENGVGSVADKFMSQIKCDVCMGERLAAEGRLVTVLGTRYPVAAKMNFEQLGQFAARLKQCLKEEQVEIVEEHLDAMLSVCHTAKRLGISYLECDRETAKISGGEAQRLKLLSAFSNHMTGILYIFDEPSKKLGIKEYSYMIDLLKELVAEGNTVLMVEHNSDMIKMADYVIEIGPAAGTKGGYLMAEGNYEDVVKHKGSLLGRYMETAESFDKGSRADRKNDGTPATLATVYDVTENNLKHVTVSFPKRALTCITGVSGSGKSSLMYGGILPQMSEKKKEFDEVILVESKLSGGNSRSVIATYTKLMDDIRKIYANTETAKELGYTEKDFSFNGGSLRCEQCKGEGKIKIPYTENAYSICPVCHGNRYKADIKRVLWKKKTITDVLAMSVEEASELFEADNASLAKKCQLLKKFGLPYLKLGQSTSEISGGEAARVKMASCLMCADVKNALFLLDEPTSGLHFSDIDHLITSLYELIDSGNTVVAIEHNKRFLSAADYTITLGPGAGDKGGYIL